MELIVVLRDLWADGHRCYSNCFHNAEDKDLAIAAAIEKVCEEAGIVDGDEVSITIKKTGNRPFGDRRIVLQKAHNYGPETDAQMEERLKNGQEGKCVCCKEVR